MTVWKSLTQFFTIFVARHFATLWRAFFKGELQRNEQRLNTSLFSNSVLAN